MINIVYYNNVLLHVTVCWVNGKLRISFCENPCPRINFKSKCLLLVQEPMIKYCEKKQQMNNQTTGRDVEPQETLMRNIQTEKRMSKLQQIDNNIQANTERPKLKNKNPKEKKTKEKQTQSEC